jgi:FtsX-like permease family
MSSPHSDRLPAAHRPTATCYPSSATIPKRSHDWSLLFGFAAADGHPCRHQPLQDQVCTVDGHIKGFGERPVSANPSSSGRRGRPGFTVIGILDRVPLAPELGLGALIGWPAAQRYLAFTGDITAVYTRTDPDAVEATRGLLARTANPAQPNEVDVSRPSDALAAEAAADTTFTGLLVGLGAVALLVGGIGVANTMVISVLERRAEIGLRRSLGATRKHIRIQFLTESLLLSLLGGGAGYCSVRA